MDDSSLTADYWRQLARASGQLSVLPAHDVDALLTTMSDALRGITDSCMCTLAIATQRSEAAADDPIDGWRIALARVPEGNLGDPDASQQLADDESYTNDPGVVWLAKRAGTRRVLRPRHSLNPGAWSQSRSRLHWESLGMADHMVAAQPVRDGVEIYVAVGRGHDNAHGDFTGIDEAHLLDALDQLKTYARRIALAFGLYRGAMLSPRERDVLRWLLQGFGEKHIADELGLSPRTVHEYVGTAYKKFRVRSRAELLALWLR